MQVITFGQPILLCTTCSANLKAFGFSAHGIRKHSGIGNDVVLFTQAQLDETVVGFKQYSTAIWSQNPVPS